MDSPGAAQRSNGLGWRADEHPAGTEHGNRLAKCAGDRNVRSREGEQPCARVIVEINRARSLIGEQLASRQIGLPCGGRADQKPVIVHRRHRRAEGIRLPCEVVDFAQLIAGQIIDEHTAGEVRRHAVELMGD